VPTRNRLGIRHEHDDRGGPVHQPRGRARNDPRADLQRRRADPASLPAVRRRRVERVPRRGPEHALDPRGHAGRDGRDLARRASLHGDEAGLGGHPARRAGVRGRLRPGAGVAGRGRRATQGRKAPGGEVSGGKQSQKTLRVKGGKNIREPKCMPRHIS
jgi:hypothetical protein